MSLPETAPKVTCTLSRPLQAEGTTGLITSAHLEIDRGLVWAASGETIYPDPVPVLVDELSGGLSFEVVPVDAEGVMDLAGNMVTDWHYILRIQVKLAENQTKTVTYRIQPTSGGLQDIDLVPQDGEVSNPPATVPGQSVTVNIGGSGLEPGGTIMGGYPWGFGPEPELV